MFKKILSSLFLSFSFFIFNLAFAATPTISLSNSGSGDYVLVAVRGDANSNVTLNYYSTFAPGVQIKNLGTTDANGNYSGLISTANLGVNTNNNVYVVVNNQQSNQVPWINNTGNVLPIFNQSTVILSIGQSTTITANNVSSLYISNNSNNSNNSIVSASVINGNQVSINGITTGSATLLVCSTNASSCTNVFVKVSNTNISAITFSQNNISISNGQSISASIYGGNGNYSLINNTNTNLASASISGSSINIYGSNSNVNGGQGSLLICTNDMIYCGVMNITSNSISNSSSLSFSQNNPTLSVGQSLSISISGSTGVYAISSNSNANILSASISGTLLSLYANNSGSTSLNICSSTSVCSVLYVTVSPNLSNTTVTTNNNVLSQISINQNINVGQSLVWTVVGGNGSYYLSNFSNSNVSASISGNSLTMTGLLAGSQLVTICSTSSSCYGFNIIVSNSTNNTQTTAIQSPTSPAIKADTNYVFNNPLSFGSRGQEVVELQKRLHSEGYFDGIYSTNYGYGTMSAVKKYQKANGLTQLGNLGPATRNLLNK